MKDTSLIAAVIALHFINECHITDKINIMRVHILAREIASKEHTLDTLKNTSAYLECNYDVPVSDKLLQEYLDAKEQLITNNDKIT